jgi:predicted membrane protein
MKKFFSQIFQDEKGNFSSKRFVGIMAALSLCVTMYHNQFTDANIAPADSLINAVAALAFGALGLASADKIFGKKSNDE